MIKSFKHAGLEAFYRTGSKRGIQPAHVGRLGEILALLDVAIAPNDMNLPGYALHPLKGRLVGHWTVRIDRMWRVTFRFEGGDVILVDYQDYH